MYGGLLIIKSSFNFGSKLENKSLFSNLTLLFRGFSNELYRLMFLEANFKILLLQSTEIILRFSSSEQRDNGIAAVPVPNSAI